MKKVYLIGDCHSARVSEHWNPEDCKVDFKVWGKAGEFAWKFDPKKLFLENTESSGYEQPNKYLGWENRLISTFQDIKDDGLVMLWIGYVDIRQLLPMHENAKECAYKYLDEAVAYFPNSQIQIIEPLPQFTEMLLKYEGISPEYTYEQRQKQNYDFCSALNEYAVEHNMLKPITQQEIKDAVGIQEFKTEHTPQGTVAPHPQDALLKEYMEKIYDLFISKAYNVLNIAVD
jgi:hypothetical protein